MDKEKMICRQSLQAWPDISLIMENILFPQMTTRYRELPGVLPGHHIFLLYPKIPFLPRVILITVTVIPTSFLPNWSSLMLTDAVPVVPEDLITGRLPAVIPHQVLY